MEHKERINILAADDDELNRELMAVILKKQGYSYQLAENGRSAVELFEREHFDMVFLDLSMPDMDGYETLKAIRDIEKSWGRHTPVIAISGYTASEEKQKSLMLGMDEYLVKPFHPDELRKIIQNILIRNEKDESNNGQGTGSAESIPEATIDMEADIQKVMDKFDLDLTVFEELVKKFEAGSTELTNKIRKDIIALDGTAVKRNMHSLKGELLIFNANHLYQIAEELEGLGNRECFDGMAGTFEELAKGIEQLIQSFYTFIRNKRLTADRK